MITATADGLSHAIAAAAFGLLALALMGRWRTRAHALGLAGACVVTAVWAASAGTLAGGVAETLRTAVWIGLLLILLRPARARAAAIGAALLLLSALTTVTQFALAVLVARLMLAVLGMLLVEQVYRNTPMRDRWGIKFACLGIGALFAYDFFLYSDATLFRHVNGEIHAARGVVNALAVPLLALSAARDPRWASGMALSRTLVFRSAALVGAALYLLAMASTGYYLRYVGGDWGRVMQLAFLCGAAIVLAGGLFSGALRARLKVLINKHFYSDRFDYRDEWQRFTRALSEGGPELGERALQAIAGLVESPAGVLWVRRDDTCEPVVGWNAPLPGARLPVGDPFCRFLQSRQWVVELPECARFPERYGQLRVPEALAAMPQLWVAVPLILQGQLFGIATLAMPRAPIKLNWEVTDLLKIAGSQAASFLAYQESANSLMVARQFESFNRMSAFIVHDLKNLVFQFSLLLGNAEKHKHNPQFQADMFGTLDDSVRKMKLLLQRLSRSDARDAAAPVRVADLLRRAAVDAGIAASAVGDTDPVVLANAGRLQRVLGHLIQNALEAGAHSVQMSLSSDGAHAIVEIRDDGQGMSEAFVRERLFQPFESTKPSGMGIGVFESREYVRELGGQLEVASAEGAGTTFRVMLPLYSPGGASHEQEEAVGH